MSKTLLFKKKIISSRSCFIEHNGKVYSYYDLDKFSNEIIKNIPSRSIILMKSYNSFMWLCAYYGFIKKKIVPILIDNNIDSSFEENLILRYRPSYIFSLESEKYEKYYKIFNRDRFCIYKNNSKSEKYKLNKNLCLLLTTSGTTGNKKFVKLSYENLYHNTRAIIKYLKINKKCKLITTLQPSYSYGLSLINTHLYSGSSIVLNNYSFFDKNFWKLFHKYKPTTFACVPRSLEFLERLGIKKINFKKLSYITLAGGALIPQKLKKINIELERKKIKLFTMYGQTEASPRISYLDPTFNRSKLGSIGKSIRGGKLFLIDKKNSILKKSNQIGEIIYIGKNVFMGYSKSLKDLSKINIKKQNILKTGDYGYRDKDGFYWIVGRKKDFVKVNGHRVNLRELNEFFRSQGFQSYCDFGNDKINIYFNNKKFINFFKNSSIVKGNLNFNNFCLIFKKNIPINDRGKIDIRKLIKDELL